MENYGNLSGLATPGGKRVGQKAYPDMARNMDGGGHAWKTDIWKQARRFFILGSDSNSYYATARKLTQMNVSALISCIESDYVRYVDMLVEMRSGGLAPKYDTALFGLALVFVKGSNDAKAYAGRNIGKICRTSSDLQEWIVLLTGEKEQGVKKHYMRGWGRSVRTATQTWATTRSLNNLVYQAIKYRSRAGTSLSNVIKLSHPNPGDDEALSAVYYWIVHGEMKPGYDYKSNPDTAQIWAFEKAKQLVSRQMLIGLILEYKLPWEAVPNTWLNDPWVLEALIQNMPIVATVRQLPRITKAGLFDSGGTKELVLNRLYNPGIVRKENIHPMRLFQANIVYGEGAGSNRKNVWVPDKDIVRALEEAFYLSFGNVQPTGLNRMIALDVSGSMDGPLFAGGNRYDEGSFRNCSGLYGVTPREAAAAMALVTMRTEPWCQVFAFSGTIAPVNLHKEMTIREVVLKTRHMRAGSTNIGAAMEYARINRMKVDLFEIYTDNEANTGLHPAHTLSRYQDATGIAAKSAFIAMVGYNDSVADPNRDDMMDFIGFDPTTPVMLNRFATGELLG